MHVSSIVSSHTCMLPFVRTERTYTRDQFSNLPHSMHIFIPILPLLSSPLPLSSASSIDLPNVLLTSMTCATRFLFNKRSPFSLHHQCTLLYTSYPSYFRLQYMERGCPCDGVMSNGSLFSSVLYCTVPSCLSFLPPFHLSPLHLLEPSSPTFLLCYFFCIPRPPPTYHHPTRSKFSF